MKGTDSIKFVYWKLGHELGLFVGITQLAQSRKAMENLIYFNLV